MKIKMLILGLVVLISTGCSATVNIKLDANNVDESVDIRATQNAIYNKEMLKTSFRKYIPAFSKDLIIDEASDVPMYDILYYNMSSKEEVDGYTFNYKYLFDIDNYKDARTIKDAFRYYKFYKEDNTIYISTDSLGIVYFDNYQDLDSVTINITTAGKVLENNADSIKGNTYTWVFNRDSKKSINMIVNTGNNLDVIDSSFVNISPILYLFLGLGCIVLVIFLFIVIKNKSNNKI